MKPGLAWVLMVFFVFGLGACSGGKQSAVEGKLVDWNGKPVAGVKITASQVQPIKGYEQFEAVTKSDGTFRIKGLFPSYAYVLKPWSDKWTSETAVSVESAPQGETAVLPKPMVIVQVFTRSEPALVADIATGAVAQSAVAGTLVDWNGKPVAGVKITASLVQPVKGYEQFETVTGSDGSFRLPNLLASSKYVLKPSTEKWRTKTSLSVDSPAHHGDTAALSAPMKISRAYSKTSGSLVIDLSTGATRFTVSSDRMITDSETGLEWVVGPDSDTNYAQATQWVAACKVAGGGWRMPTRQELRTLYQKGVGQKNIDPAFKTTGASVWAEPDDSSSVWRFRFYDGRPTSLGFQGDSYYRGGIRVFGVRSRPR